MKEFITIMALWMIHGGIHGFEMQNIVYEVFPYTTQWWSPSKQQCLYKDMGLEF